MWNSNIPLHRVLKQVSFKLGLDINIIGFRRWRNNRDNLGYCTHNTNSCMFPYFKFQNTLTKLLFPISPNFCQINLLFYQNKYYILLTNHQLKPFLINLFSTDSLVFNNTSITRADILNILKNQFDPYPFSVALYTSFAYLTHNWTKKIQQTLIGYSLGKENSEIVHIFITPNLSSTLFSLSILDSLTTNVTQFNKKNVFANSHITEGLSTRLNNNCDNQDLLNQNFCVCEHSESQQLLVPEETSFKPLGNT